MVLTVNIKGTFFIYYFYAFSHKKAERDKKQAEHNSIIDKK